MRYLKTFENTQLIPEEYSEFIKWLIIKSSTDEKRKFAYDKRKDKWLNLSDYETYYTLDELFLIYKNEKYNI